MALKSLNNFTTLEIWDGCGRPLYMHFVTWPKGHIILYTWMLLCSSPFPRHELVTRIFWHPLWGLVKLFSLSFVIALYFLFLMMRPLRNTRRTSRIYIYIYQQIIIFIIKCFISIFNSILWIKKSFHCNSLFRMKISNTKIIRNSIKIIKYR